MLKAIIKSRFGHWLLSRMIRIYLRLLRLSSGAKFEGMEHFEKAYGEGKGVIIAFWHERLLLSHGLLAFSPVIVNMLVSGHSDGDIIAAGAADKKVNFIRGSAGNPKKSFKNKKGASAMLKMLSYLKDGQVIVVTPDGPRGPARQVQRGVIHLAMHSGAPIIPVGLSARRGRHLKSWDRLFLVYPFNRCGFLLGEPLYLGEKLSEQEERDYGLELEKRLQEITLQADKLVGKTVISRHNDFEDMRE